MRKPTRKPNPELKFSTKSRFEYLRGFSARKEERRRKGNKVNLRKQLQERKEEKSSYRTHIQEEYKKAVDAVTHNSRVGHTTLPLEEMVATETSCIDESVTHFEQNDNSDPFGNVSVHVTSLESPNFVKFAQLDAAAPIPAPKPKLKPLPTKKTVAKPFKAAKSKKSRKSFGKSSSKKSKPQKMRPGQK